MNQASVGSQRHIWNQMRSGEIGEQQREVLARLFHGLFPLETKTGLRGMLKTCHAELSCASEDLDKRKLQDMKRMSLDGIAFLIEHGIDYVARPFGRPPFWGEPE